MLSTMACLSGCKSSLTVVCACYAGQESLNKLILIGEVAK